MASTHETHQTVDPTGDLDYYRNRVHQLESKVVAVRAVVNADPRLAAALHRRGVGVDSAAGAVDRPSRLMPPASTVDRYLSMGVADITYITDTGPC